MNRENSPSWSAIGVATNRVVRWARWAYWMPPSPQVLAAVNREVSEDLGPLIACLGKDDLRWFKALVQMSHLKTTASRMERARRDLIQIRDMLQGDPADCVDGAIRRLESFSHYAHRVSGASPSKVD